jgi:hypothetical protein
LVGFTSTHHRGSECGSFTNRKRLFSIDYGF